MGVKPGEEVCICGESDNTPDIFLLSLTGGGEVDLEATRFGRGGKCEALKSDIFNENVAETVN